MTMKEEIANIKKILDNYEHRLQVLEGVPVIDNREKSPEFVGLREFVKDVNVAYGETKMTTTQLLKSLEWGKYLTRKMRYGNKLYNYTLTSKGEESNYVTVINGASAILINVAKASEIVELYKKYEKAVIEMMAKGVEE